MKKKVLFLCHGNSCQSQMAEGLLKHFYGKKYDVFSAGINPVDVNKNAIEVMKEIGIDISNQASKHINEFLDQKFDIIVTFNDVNQISYPTFLDRVENIQWEFFNPAEGIDKQGNLLNAFRELRDGIKEKIVEHFHH